ncbi:MAG: ClbS/DfsB family four-helix bundle protein [Chloroflexota bacterium]
MNTKESLINIMESSHQRILQVISKINPDREIYPGWTSKEVLAHLSGWDELVINYLESIIVGQVPAVIEGLDIDEYNLQAVKKRSGIDYARVYQEYKDLRKNLLKLLSSVPDDQVEISQMLPWGETGTLLDVVNVFGPHEAGHADDMDELLHKGSR